MPTTFAKSFSLLALTAAACAAQASPISVTVTDWAFDEGQQVKLSDTANDWTYSGRAGGFSASLRGAGLLDAPSFITYCIELEEGFKFSANALPGYRVMDGASYFAERRQDSAIADKLGRLMTYVAADPKRVDSSIESTSLQLAVWNLVYDHDYALSEGRLRDASPYAAYATQLLAGASRTTASAYDVYALTAPGTQDFLLLSAKAPNVVKTGGDDGDNKPPKSANVPEPGSLALAGAALLGLALVRHRKGSKTRA